MRASNTPLAQPIATADTRSRSLEIGLLIVACILCLVSQHVHAQSSADDIRAQMDAIYARVQTLRMSYDKKDQLKADGMMRDYEKLKSRLELEIRTQGRSTKVTTPQRIEPNAKPVSGPNPTTASLSVADTQRRDKTEAAIQKCMDSIRLPDGCAALMTTDCVNAKVREKRRCEAIGLAPATSP